MHIKELVLDDFKSFGRKTHIPFYEDFTTISGPNGSGKSNIIDSVLFALGLARSTGIRAEKLTDLIYNPEGESAPDVREASVTVVLDNTDGTIPRSQVVSAAGTESVGEVDEISVKRRIKQTEENYYSYYYLNGRSVNLSDIQDLLATVGIAPEGYNVVMQGDVTEIISMTPYARRGIIDEIAGVAEFDARKEDATEELAVVRDRIEEADLRIEEKANRLEQLESERETALKYQSLKEEQEEYESYREIAECERKKARLESTTERIEDATETLEEHRRTLDERQGRVTRLESELADLNEEIERTGEEEQLEIKREIEEIKGEIARREDAIETCEERKESAEQKRSQAFVKLDRKQETVEEFEADIKTRKVEKSSLKADKAELAAERTEIEEEIEAIDTEYEQLKESLADHRDSLEETKAEKNEIQREQDRLLDEARRRSTQHRELESEIEKLTEERAELKEQREDLTAELESASENKSTIQDAVNDLRDEKYDLQDQLDRIEEKLTAVQQEYAELEAQTDSDDSSYGRSVTTILNSDLAGVHGTVGQQGSVQSEYATACETAAGGRLAHVIVDNDGVGQTCIEHLKSRNAGRATFLPISQMQNRSLPRLPDHDGVVEFAANLVEYDSEYAGVFSYVLGSTLVVEDLDTARELMGEYRLVTLDGDLAEKSGAMTGGSTKGTRYSFSSSNGRLADLAERITELEDRRKSIRGRIRSVESKLDDARERQSEATDAVRDIQHELNAIEEDIDATAAEIETKEAERTEIEAEREDVSDRMEAVEAEIDAIDEEKAAIESEIDECETELRNSEVAELTAQAESLREEIAGLDEEMDALDGELNELALEKQYAEEAISSLHDEIEAAQNRTATQEEEITEHEEAIEDQEALLSEKRKQVADLEAELAELKEERAELKERLTESRNEYESAENAVKKTESRIESLQESTTRLREEIAQLEAEIQLEEYDPEEIPSLDTVEREIERLEREMKAMEPVNMLAIDEYDTVAAELDDLEDRRETLFEERDGIERRIEQYEENKKATFMDAYEGINEEFEEIFTRLSDGFGTLVLEDEADPFEGGLTMKAQPGDKPVQRLAAMSGGEKSLTALAFIFAIQRYNPAPFYALDEVDAFLDAANADSVGELIDELAGNAQFIVVSHRSALLDRSERAIGVTMQQNNISAVTGIDLSTEVPADD